ncbi:MAG: AbiJ-NTD4 domain-containing protein [Steroidobacteraceae bacterium]
MFQNFTRRHQLDHFESDLRYEYIPPGFRYDLFKLVQENCGEEASSLREYAMYRGASISINADYFQLFSVDEIHEYYSPDLFVDLLLKAKWHHILSIVEFLINEGPLSDAEVNQLFNYHNVGYEVEQEANDSWKVVVKYIALIEESNQVISSDIPYKPVIEAITAAKEALVDPKKIDVASSIAHSVVAVEAYLRGWLNSKGLKPATLGDAIKIVRKASLCPAHIVESLEQFYIYRNRTENVGHGAPAFADISREDALLCSEMAVSFINYFHRKARPQ